ncbi:hypothetical protein OR623_02120, partial [Aeromonas hydrophila]|nr:hypothetical protein [Aeromonas hydrophila]
RLGFFSFPTPHSFSIISPRIASFASRDSVKHAEPDGGHAGMGPFHPVFLAGWNIDVVARAQLYT